MIIPLKSARRLGSIPGCVALQAHDVGVGFDDRGDACYFAWGANWSLSEAHNYMGLTGVAVVELETVYPDGGPPGGRRNFAPVITDAIYRKLQPILVTDD